MEPGQSFQKLTFFRCGEPARNAGIGFPFGALREKRFQASPDVFLGFCPEHAEASRRLKPALLPDQFLGGFVAEIGTEKTVEIIGESASEERTWTVRPFFQQERRGPVVPGLRNIGQMEQIGAGEMADFLQDGGHRVDRDRRITVRVPQAGVLVGVFLSQKGKRLAAASVFKAQGKGKCKGIVKPGDDQNRFDLPVSAYGCMPGLDPPKALIGQTVRMFFKRKPGGRGFFHIPVDRDVVTFGCEGRAGHFGSRRHGFKRVCA